MYTVFLEDFTYPLEKEMATHSRQRTLAGYSPWGLKESDMTDVT